MTGNIISYGFMQIVRDRLLTSDLTNDTHCRMNSDDDDDDGQTEPFFKFKYRTWRKNKKDFFNKYCAELNKCILVNFACLLPAAGY